MDTSEPYTPQNIIDLMALANNTSEMSAGQCMMFLLDASKMLKAASFEIQKLTELNGRGLVKSPKLRTITTQLKDVAKQCALPMLLDMIEDFENANHGTDNDSFRLDLAMMLYHTAIAEQGCKIALEISYAMGFAPNGKRLPEED